MKRQFALIAVVMLTLATPGVHAQWVIAAAVQPPPPPPPPPPQLRSAMRVPLETNAIKGAPYSADLLIESTQVLADGNRIVSRSTGRVYRDSEGRVRREEDRPSGSPTISISDPESGVSYSLDPETRIAWKTPGRAAAKIEDLRRDLEKTVAALEARDQVRRREEERRAEVESQGRAAAGGGRGRGAVARVNEQRSEEGLQARPIEGVRAEGVRRTTTIPAGEIGNVLPIKIVTEEWTSPELKVLVLTQHSDPRIGESSYRLLNIIRGEPNPTFFQVPPDYTVKETGIRKFEVRRQ